MNDFERLAFLSLDELSEFRTAILAWYDGNRRDLPWRHTSDAYAIWVSEIMLQQTRVAAVLGRYEEFLRKFPTVLALANAAEADVLALWSGLGYYRRARMLHKAAQVVAREHDGVLPKTAAALRALPGIGAYTAAAIASIAYGDPVAVVDGNVQRVVQRLAGWGSSESKGQGELARSTERLANTLLDPSRPGDFNQSMMELGATVCLPKNPVCLQCPLARHCKTRGEHPTRPRARMSSQDAAYALVLRSRGRHREVLLDQRPSDQTVMPGLWELPALRETQVADDQLRMTVRHSIMQVNYYVRIRMVREEEVQALTVPADRRHWFQLHDLAGLPLTGLARKVLLRTRIPEVRLSATVLEFAAPAPQPRAKRAQASRTPDRA